MKSISVAAAAVLLCSATVVAAGQPGSPDPMHQAVESLRENVQGQPQNSGLQRAIKRIVKNKDAFEDRRDSKSQPPRGAEGQGRERNEQTQRVDRGGAARSVERAQSVERTERPDRPERVGRVGFESQVLVDRPGRSERRGRR